MPRWVVTTKSRGRPVRVEFKLPVLFKINTVLKVVDEMPRFSGCNNFSTKQERTQCSDRKISQFIFKNLKYPKEATEKLIHGRLVVQFVVSKTGKIENIKMLKDPGGVFENEIKRVFGLMPKWIPGQHEGRPVKVEMTFPINIKPE